MVQKSPHGTPSRRTPNRAPGQKQPRQSWTFCQKCDVKAMLNHDCDVPGPFVNSNLMKLYSVYKDTLYCHMHPDTLKEFGLKIGSFVRIESNVFECWPDTSILLDHVAYNAQERSLITVNIVENIKNAVQVTIAVNGTLEKSYMPFILQDRIIFCGQRISIPHINQNLTIDIHSVSVCNETENGSDSFGVSSLSDSLAKSSLSDSYYRVLATSHFVEKMSLAALPKSIGTEKIMQDIVSVVEQCLEKYATFGTMGPPKTLLITGPSGSGKSLLAKTILQAVDYYSCIISDFNKSISYEEHVKVILLDGIDSVKDDDNEKVMRISDFLNNLPERKFVIGTSSILPSAFRKFFPLQMEMPAMTSDMRLQIFKTYINDIQQSENSVSISDNDLTILASKSHGYVGADICNVCRQALLMAAKGNLTLSDLLAALTKVPPRSMNDIKIEVPEVRWSEIGGLKDVQELLTRVISWPLIHQERYRQMGIVPPKGVLMYGPPGCCKTMMAKALATESGLNFLSVKGPELLSMYVGESERAIRDLFSRARTAAPSIIFFDEIDALATHRGADKGGSGVHDRVLAQMLTELDGVEGLAGVVVIAATNRPDRLDKALIRPGRLEKLVYIPPPDLDCRIEILKIKFSKIPHDDSLKLEEIAKSMSSFSGAEVVAACNAAGIQSIESGTVTHDSLSKAINNISPQITKDMLQFYEEFNTSFTK